MITSTEPVHALVDFVALAAQLTNEQKILACLERIEVLLTPKQETCGAVQKPLEQPKAEAGKFTGRRK